MPYEWKVAIPQIGKHLLENIPIKIILICNTIHITALMIFKYMSRIMGKPTICICENKGADQLPGYRIVQFLFYLNPKFQASSSFLCLYRSVCVGPLRKPHCWFSHEAAHMSIVNKLIITQFHLYYPLIPWTPKIVL